MELFGRMVTFIQGAHRKADEALAESGITSTQFYLLRHVAHSSPVMQLRLASSLGVTPGAVSQQIARLEGLGLLKRVRMGKKKLLELTEDGLRTVKTLEAGHAPFMKSLFSSISEQERRDLLAILKKLDGD